MLWSGQHAPSKIDELLAQGKIEENWMICPLGRSDQALEVRQYLQDRHVFARMEKQEAADRAAEKAVRKAVPKPRLKIWGEYLFGITCAYAVIGRILSRFLFSRELIQAWGPLHYLLLIPLWALGVATIVLWLTGCVQHQLRANAAVKKLRSDAANFPIPNDIPHS
ncbi:hypothetical protein [Lignipirellula cremea]|uniref:hypothetical protein n=1 Tax=Lignipirellula cremea TaxID=2528010 RepID=UPI0011A6E99F|nr:hypothetical protein [Lignipirellula cremea]